MNILVDPMATSIDIDGLSYKIDTDYRSIIRSILAYEDDTLSVIEKHSILLENLYLEMPDDFNKALFAAIKFLNANQDLEDDVEPMRLYSFSKDASLIFAAFKQTHNIDLESVKMHWWKFLSLFMDLGSDTAFCNLVSLRHRVKSGKATKEERQAALELGDIFELSEPDTRTAEEIELDRVFTDLVTKR